MSSSATREQLDRWSPHEASLEACDESQGASGEGDDHPQALLVAFARHMAAQGQPVRVDLMRRDREYALWQLARARGMDDPELKHLATRLFACLTKPT